MKHFVEILLFLQNIKTDEVWKFSLTVVIIDGLKA
jgi:hypothetical protein